MIQVGLYLSGVESTYGKLIRGKVYELISKWEQSKIFPIGKWNTDVTQAFYSTELLDQMLNEALGN